MGAGQGRSRRAQDAVAVFDLKRAVTSDKSGLAAEILQVFRGHGGEMSKITAVLWDGEEAGAYTLTCSALDGIEVTNMLADGRWNLGAHFSLQEDGDWSVKAFSFDPKKQEEVLSRSTATVSTSSIQLTKLKEDIQKITSTATWGEGRTVAEIVQALPLGAQ